MKIYFAAPLQDSTIEKIEFYNQIIQYLSCYGEVLTEKIGDKEFQLKSRKTGIPSEKIHDYDLNLLLESEVVITEITTPSLGVGYEIGRAIENKKPVLCLYNKNVTEPRNISRMILGAPGIKVWGYKTLKDVKLAIKKFFKNIFDNS